MRESLAELKRQMRELDAQLDAEWCKNGESPDYLDMLSIQESIIAEINARKGK